MFGRKLSLPVLGPRPLPPSVDVMRRRLGGRASTEAGSGEVVAFETDGGVAFSGVVLFVRGDELDVWVAENVVRRTRRARARPLGDLAPDRDVEGLAKDARTFGALVEGDRVRYLDADHVGEGTLVEKCRFGGLVERGDGKILGVGFRKLWPAEAKPSSRPS